MKSKYIDGDRVGLSKSDQLDLLKHYKKTSSGLFVPEETRDIRKQTCGGCGCELHGRKTAEHFGETFCFDCVDKWRHGVK